MRATPQPPADEAAVATPPTDPNDPLIERLREMGADV